MKVFFIWNQSKISSAWLWNRDLPQWGRKRRTCSIQMSSSQLAWTLCSFRRCRLELQRIDPSTNFNCDKVKVEERRINSWTYWELLCVSLVSGVDLLHVILSVSDYDLMRIAVELEDDSDQVLLAVFNKPTCELQVLDLVCFKRYIVRH